jgi:hypothetical protein
MVFCKSLEASLRRQSFEEWWGCSKEHGWIVLYWETPGNREKATRTFVRCCDWKAVTVNIKEWGEPNFLYASVYLKLIRDTDKRAAALNKLEGYRQQAKLEGCRQQATRKVMIEAHEQFLQSCNVEYQGVRSIINKQHRVTHCWHCKKNLDNNANVECVACNWMLCHCGACGCSYGNNA